jgi:serine/threonine protein kinase/formylglycine-generating enzyme required for sulfatase activity
MPSPSTVPPELANHPKFRIVRELGRGGMGVIYLAQHRVMEKPVALKVINPSILDNPNALARFHAEVKAAGKLDHTNVARAHDADQAGDLHFLVMEYVEGMTLAQLLKQQGPLPVLNACRYIHQAALGLQHAFEQGMTHRDVKPANLMVTPQGRVKVMDFGLARLRSEQTDGRGLTATGAFMGTPEYVAPEQATDARQADTRADIYSLGCTLYALLAGRPPFAEDTVVKLVLAHLEKEPMPLHQLRPDVPAALSAVVGRMLAKDAAQRYQTPLDVARALAPFTKVGPPAIPAPEPPQPGTSMSKETRSPPTRNRTKGRSATAPGVQDSSPFRHLVDTPVPAAKKAMARRRPVKVLGVVAAVTVVVASLAAVLITALKKPEGNQGQTSNTSTKAARTDAMPGPQKREGPVPLDCTGPAGVSAAEVRHSQETWAKYLGRQVEETIEIADGAKMTFVLVPPGKFLMGSPREEQDYVTNTFYNGKRPEWLDNETLHTVTLTEPFYLGKTEVTQAQYEALTGENPSKFKGADKPVEQVRWQDARSYGEKLTKKLDDKHVYRLPSEAEWEYACRGGRPSSKPFGIGDGRSLSSQLANFDGNSPYGDADKGPSLQSTCAVRSYSANALGLHDMHGNLYEWCADWYAPYPARDVTNPTGPSEGVSGRVVRGGGWSYGAGVCRAANRWLEPGYRLYDLGFRLARSVPSGVK